MDFGFKVGTARNGVRALPFVRRKPLFANNHRGLTVGLIAVGIFLLISRLGGSNSTPASPGEVAHDQR